MTRTDTAPSAPEPHELTRRFLVKQVGPDWCVLDAVGGLRMRCEDRGAAVDLAGTLECYRRIFAG